MYGYEKFVYAIRVLKTDYRKRKELLLIWKDGKSDYVLIENFKRLTYRITPKKCKKYKIFCFVYQVLVVKNIWKKDKKELFKN